MNDSGGRPLLRVIRTLHCVESRLESVLEPLGLSLAKLGALSKLVEAGEPIPLGSLAERLSCVRSNITQLVDRLESEGLVARVHDARDRRSVRAALTDEGRARHAAGLAAFEAAEQDLFEGLSDERKSQLLGLLDVLAGGR
jgi:DNA-binding MarR family transcriptional regulator